MCLVSPVLCPFLARGIHIGQCPFSQLRITCAKYVWKLIQYICLYQADERKTQEAREAREHVLKLRELEHRHSGSDNSAPSGSFDMAEIAH